MRVSMDRDDPGFFGGPLPGIRILLDGIERTRVVTADEEKRLLVRYVTDERGQMRLNAAGDGVERETLTGDVVIVGDEKMLDIVRAVQTVKRNLPHQTAYNEAR